MSEYLSKDEYIAKYYNEPKQELLTDLYYKTRDNNLLQQENKQLKELKYKFFDNSGDEESFTLEDYLEIGNKLYDYEQENKQLKEQMKEKKKRNIEILRRFEACIKLLNKLDFDKYAYSTSSLETIKNDLLDILILGDKE